MNVDQIGDFLEQQGLSDEAIDDHFEHFGVGGMKWGIRKGKSQTGISRARGSLIDRNNLMKSNIRKAQSGQKYKISVAIGRKFVGEKKQKENWAKFTKDLNSQNKRVRSGKLKAKDHLAVIGGTAIVDLFITTRQKDSRRPKG